MTFYYDEKLKQLSSIEPAGFNSMNEFANSLTHTLKKSTTSQKLRSSIFYQHRQKNPEANF